MPSCKNGKGSYKGTEPSPKGRGFCAKHERIPTFWQVTKIKKN